MASWDIFCRVVDNYGDAGVCWRLARQLAEERGQAVRLWCDDLSVLAALCPQVATDAVVQRVGSLEVRLWYERFASVVPADVVIEAFACDLPPSFTAAMAERRQAPVWLNLEYLSAEDWVADCHRRSSPHPRLPLVKYFFFPGFTAATGGLLREADLTARRRDFQADPARMWAQLRLPPPSQEETSVSLFSYESPALPSLIEQWAAGRQPLRCFVRSGRALTQLGKTLGLTLAPGEIVHQGRLSIHALPFVPQEDFDPLLWACDLNFVRGEDSFVRAQWSARPMVWHIYPQDDDAHRHKLAAFVDRYVDGLSGDAARACRAFWEAWNHGSAPDWADFWQHRDALSRHAVQWADQRADEPDLASQLVDFVRNRLE